MCGLSPKRQRKKQPTEWIERLVKYKPKTKPFKHQARATIAAVKARNYGIFMEPRLGKSKAALDYVGILALKGEVRRVLILSPRIAVDVWERELVKHFPYPAHVETFDEEWWLNPLEDFKPVYFFLAGREETWRISGRTKKGKIIHAKKQKILADWRPDVVIFDESHQYKRPGGRGAQDAWRFVRRLRVGFGNGRPWVLLLSGTPNPKGWRDLFAQFRLMDETIFGTSASAFDERHVVYGHGKRRYTILKYRNEKRILERVRANSISVSAEEAGLQGTREWNPIRVELPARAMTAYMEMAKDFMTTVEGELVTAKNIGVMRLRLLQILGGFTTDGKEIHRAKVDAVRDWVALLQEQDEPYIVGCRFTPEVLAVAESLTKFSRVEVIHGATRKSRDVAIKEFQRGRLDGLVFQVQSGTAAIDLSRAAELVYYTLPDGWIDFKQFGDRVMGPNQSRPVRFTPILARGTIDPRIIRALIRKEDWHSEMMKSPERFLRGLI